MSESITEHPATIRVRDAILRRTANGSARILVVDDEPRNGKLLEVLLRAQGYVVNVALNGEQALAAVAQQPPDLILLDVMMPGMDGFQVARHLKVASETRAIPIILVTSLDDRNSHLAGLRAGAEEFLTKPIDRAELEVRVRNLLRLKEYSDFLAEDARILEERVQQRSAQLDQSFRDTIHTLNRAASFRDEETGGHVQRISYYCVELAQTLGMDSVFCECIYYASPMHDLGKIAIPDRVLLKPGRLDPAEWEIMKTHAALGAQMLAGGDSPYLRMGRDIALSHHERWDGTGYPDGLLGEAIPFAARLMCIADVYDALRSRRPYKPALDHATALEIITQGDGRTSPKHFDPRVLTAFVQSQDRLGEIYAEHTD